MSDREGRPDRTMEHPIWDEFLAPDISKLTKQKLPPVHKRIRPNPIQFAITAILFPKIPQTTRVRVFNFTRRALSVFDSYGISRVQYAKYFRYRDPIYYLEALQSFENCLAAAYQGHELLFGMTGTDFRGETRRGELNARMGRLYNAAKHTEGFIKRASFNGDTVSMWVTNEGLATRNDMILFSELHEIVEDMSFTACILAKSHLWRGETVPHFWGNALAKGGRVSSVIEGGLLSSARRNPPSTPDGAAP